MCSVSIKRVQIISTVFLALTFTHKHPENETSQGFYALTGIFYVLGKVTSHMSLQWVPYPTQIVGKCETKNLLINVIVGCE